MEQLFLFQLLIEDIQLLVAKAADGASNSLRDKIRVRVKSGAAFQFFIESNQSLKERAERNTDFNSGKSILFASSGDKLIKAMTKEKLELKISHIKNDELIGVVNITWPQQFVAAIKEMNKIEKRNPIPDNNRYDIILAKNKVGFVNVFMCFNVFGRIIELNMQALLSSNTDFGKAEKKRKDTTPEVLARPSKEVINKQSARSIPLFVCPYKEKESFMEPELKIFAELAGIILRPSWSETLTPDYINSKLCGDRHCPGALKFRDLGIGPLATKGAGIGTITKDIGSAKPDGLYGISQAYGTMDNYGAYGLLVKDRPISRKCCGSPDCPYVKFQKLKTNLLEHGSNNCSFMKIREEVENFARKRSDHYKSKIIYQNENIRCDNDECPEKNPECPFSKTRRPVDCSNDNNYHIKKVCGCHDTVPNKNRTPTTCPKTGPPCCGQDREEKRQSGCNYEIDYGQRQSGGADYPPEKTKTSRPKKRLSAGADNDSQSVENAETTSSITKPNNYFQMNEDIRLKLQTATADLQKLGRELVSASRDNQSQRLMPTGKPQTAGEISSPKIGDDEQLKPKTAGAMNSSKIRVEIEPKSLLDKLQICINIKVKPKEIEDQEQRPPSEQTDIPQSVVELNQQSPGVVTHRRLSAGADNLVSGTSSVEVNEEAATDSDDESEEDDDDNLSKNRKIKPQSAGGVRSLKTRNITKPRTAKGKRTADSKRLSAGSDLVKDLSRTAKIPKKPSLIPKRLSILNNRNSPSPKISKFSPTLIGLDSDPSDANLSKWRKRIWGSKSGKSSPDEKKSKIPKRNTQSPDTSTINAPSPPKIAPSILAGSKKQGEPKTTKKQSVLTKNPASPVNTKTGLKKVQNDSTEDKSKSKIIGKVRKQQSVSSKSPKLGSIIKEFGSDLSTPKTSTEEQNRRISRAQYNLIASGSSKYNRKILKDPSLASSRRQSILTASNSPIKIAPKYGSPNLKVADSPIRIASKYTPASHRRGVIDRKPTTSGAVKKNSNQVPVTQIDSPTDTTIVKPQTAKSKNSQKQSSGDKYFHRKSYDYHSFVPGKGAPKFCPKLKTYKKKTSPGSSNSSQYSSNSIRKSCGIHDLLPYVTSEKHLNRQRGGADRCGCKSQKNDGTDCCGCQSQKNDGAANGCGCQGEKRKPSILKTTGCGGGCGGTDDPSQTDDRKLTFDCGGTVCPLSSYDSMNEAGSPENPCSDPTCLYNEFTNFNFPKPELQPVSNYDYDGYNPPQESTKSMYNYVVFGMDQEDEDEYDFKKFKERQARRQNKKQRLAEEKPPPKKTGPCSRETCRHVRQKICSECMGASRSGATCDNSKLSFSTVSYNDSECGVYKDEMDGEDKKDQMSIVSVRMKKKPKRSKRFVYHHGATYPGSRIGHKTCNILGKAVPPNMGWLWNSPCMSGLKRHRAWRPGLVGKTIQERIVMRRRQLGIPDPPEITILSKKKRHTARYQSDSEESDEDYVPKPTLVIQKKDGNYLITMNPLKDPRTIAPNEYPYIECAPMQFIITKIKPEQPEIKPLTTNLMGEEFGEGYEHKCLCDEDSGSESSDSELNIEFTTPAGLICPDRLKRIPNVIHTDTQFKENDFNCEDCKFIVPLKYKNKRKRRGGR